MQMKEKILWEALGLFSQRGYDAVSVRELAKAVGIRESSLYHYFPGKQAIFDSLVELCWEKAQEYFQAQGLPFSAEDDLSIFGQSSLAPQGETLAGLFRYFFDDPWNSQFRRLLVVSQYAHEQAGAVYQKLYRDYPLQVEEEIFRRLMAEGKCPQGDPAAMALGFYGGVFLLLHTCESWEEAQPRFMAHLRQFTRQQGFAAGTEEENL